jgi:hypothetical protein
MPIHEDFLTAIIEKGIEAATRDYEHDERRKQGSVDGFNACRGKSPEDLLTLLSSARKECQLIRSGEKGDELYWYWRCYELEVEWVLNCLSVKLTMEDKPALLPHLPTLRAAITVAEILGTKPAITPHG